MALKGLKFILKVNWALIRIRSNHFYIIFFPEFNSHYNLIIKYHCLSFFLNCLKSNVKF